MQGPPQTPVPKYFIFWTLGLCLSCWMRVPQALFPKYIPTKKLLVPPCVFRPSPILIGRTQAWAWCEVSWCQSEHLGAGTLESTIYPTAGNRTPVLLGHRPFWILERNKIFFHTTTMTKLYQFIIYLRISNLT